MPTTGTYQTYLPNIQISGSITKLFSIDFVNIYFFQSIVFANIYLFSMFISIDSARSKSVGFPNTAQAKVIQFFVVRAIGGIISARSVGKIIVLIIGSVKVDKSKKTLIIEPKKPVLLCQHKLHKNRPHLFTL